MWYPLLLEIPEDPVSPKVFLSPSASLHEGFSCNWEAGLFLPSMRCLSEQGRGLLNHQSNVRQRFPSFRAAETRSSIHCCCANCWARRSSPHLERPYFYIHCTRVPAVAPQTAHWSHKLECRGVCPEQHIDSVWMEKGQSHRLSQRNAVLTDTSSPKGKIRRCRKAWGGMPLPRDVQGTLDHKVNLPDQDFSL